MALLASGVVSGLGFGRALVLAEVGALSHLALDLPTAWGTIALYPWSNARLALDWVFIIDPVLWVIFAVGLLAGWRRLGLRPRTAAISLVVAAFYVATAGALHELAERAVRERLAAVPLVQSGTRSDSAPSGTQGDSEPSETQAPSGDSLGDVEVLPLPFSPTRWHAVAWRGDELLYADVSGFPPAARPTGREPHGLGDPRVHRALFTPAGQAFLWWARVPAGRVLREGERTVVGLADRRFSIRGNDLFALEIALDEEGRYLGAAWEGDSVFREAP